MTTKTEILRTIKSHCAECCGGNVLEVKLCTVERCPLYSLDLVRTLTLQEKALKYIEKSPYRRTIKKQLHSVRQGSS